MGHMGAQASLTTQISLAEHPSLLAWSTAHIALDRVTFLLTFPEVPSNARCRPQASQGWWQGRDKGGNGGKHEDGKDEDEEDSGDASDSDDAEPPSPKSQYKPTIEPTPTSSSGASTSSTATGPGRPDKYKLTPGTQNTASPAQDALSIGVSNGHLGVPEAHRSSLLPLSGPISPVSNSIVLLDDSRTHTRNPSALQQQPNSSVTLEIVTTSTTSLLSAPMCIVPGEDTQHPIEFECGNDNDNDDKYTGLVKDGVGAENNKIGQDDEDSDDEEDPADLSADENNAGGKLPSISQKSMAFKYSLGSSLLPMKRVKYYYKQFLEGAFPSLHENIIPVEKYAHLEPFIIPPQIQVQVKTMPSAIDDNMCKILDTLPVDGSAGQIIIGFDSEWNVEASLYGGVISRRKTAVIQIAYENTIYILQVKRLLASRKLPHHLKLLLRNPNVLKIGRLVNTDLQYLQTACDESEPFVGGLDLAKLTKE
ncbi:hypothetical protein BJ912DRAFT_1054812 [Pholiota molesta]|nr:hypothetical protein BJ912DRAFT_1054812 [Pholiota molesta]